jgi:hypothetical protein
VFTTIVFHGDNLLHHLVTRLVCDLPAPVAWYTLERIAILAVGKTVLGWCGAPPYLAGRPFVVVLSAADGSRDQIRAMAAHELAHAWLMPEPAPGVMSPPAFWQDTVLFSKLEDVPAAARQAIADAQCENARQERLARALVRSWGFQHFC